jgi:hypothetical protein
MSHVELGFSQEKWDNTLFGRIVMDYRGQAEQARKSAELLEEKVGLLNRLAEIDAAIGGGTATVAVATKPKAAKTVTASGDAPKRRGRPPKNAATAAPVAATSDGVAAAPKRRGRPPKNPNAVAVVKEKRLELPSLLQTIVQTHGKPMKHEELVVAARTAGYKSDASDFSNMVYQALVKLVKKGTFAKANEGKNAEYTFRAAS